MSDIKLISRDYDGGSPNMPEGVGDVYRMQDLNRDLEYLREKSGRALLDLFGVSDSALVSGGVVSQGTGDTLNITAAVGYVKKEVDVPNSYASNPPTVTQAFSVWRVAAAAQTNLVIGSATLDGVTVNYVKLQAAESGSTTRARLKSTGTWVYEKTDSYAIVVSSVAPTVEDIVLATFVGSGGGSFTFSEQKLPNRVVKPEWTIPWEFGTGGSVSGTVGSADLAALTNTDVAFFDVTNAELRTYRFNGNTWAIVGSGLSISGGGTSVSLAALNATDVAFIVDGPDELRTYRFNGSTWALVGSGLSLTGTSQRIAALNATDVAFIDATNDELRTYRFNGSTWSLVGSGLSVTTGTAYMTALNSTDIAFVDNSNDELRTYRFNGSTWALVGSGLSLGAVNSPQIAALNSTDVGYIDTTNDEFRTYRFDGSVWSQVGSGLTVTASIQGITAINLTDVAVFDSTPDDIVTYRFGFGLPA